MTPAESDFELQESVWSIRVQAVMMSLSAGFLWLLVLNWYFSYIPIAAPVCAVIFMAIIATMAALWTIFCRKRVKLKLTKNDLVLTTGDKTVAIKTHSMLSYQDCSESSIKIKSDNADIIIPDSVFPTHEARREFIRRIDECISTNRSHGAT